MWNYVAMFEYPINNVGKNLKMAKLLNSLYGGPQGELGSALRYLNQAITMPDERGCKLLKDIGTEELAHIEIIGHLIKQLTKGASLEELKHAGLDGKYVEHGFDNYFENVEGVPFTASYFSSVGCPLANLTEDMAAEMKAKAVYEHLLDLSNDASLNQVLLFLRQREIVHYNLFKGLFDYYTSIGLK